MPDEKVVVPTVAPVVAAPAVPAPEKYVTLEKFAKLVTLLADHGIHLK